MRNHVEAWTPQKEQRDKQVKYIIDTASVIADKLSELFTRIGNNSQQYLKDEFSETDQPMNKKCMADKMFETDPFGFNEQMPGSKPVNLSEGFVFKDKHQY